MTIQDNTTENVTSVNSDGQGYALLDKINDTVNLPQLTTTNLVFRSEGTYSDFVDFYLDGKKLTEGTDYDSEEGSTKITVRAQTFRNAGVGTHTI